MLVKFLKTAAFIAIIAFCIWALWTGQQRPRPSVIAAVPTAECTPTSLPDAFYALDGALREFDDALQLAINVPRELVVGQVEQLQRVRREVEAHVVPACLDAYKTSLVSYMNRVVELLIAFVAGATPEQVSLGLAGTTDLRQAVYNEFALVAGASPTPYPTPMPIMEATPAAGVGIPVTGAPTDAVVSVTNPDGVNLREGPGVNYTFEVVLQAGSQLAAVGSDVSRQWIFVEANEYAGWVFLPLVELNVPVDSLPVIESP